MRDALLGRPGAAGRAGAIVAGVAGVATAAAGYALGHVPTRSGVAFAHGPVAAYARRPDGETDSAPDAEPAPAAGGGPR
ncbi:hypothetical protein ABZ611_09420 [Streptomyces sp. NPDC007861]|uniref:hypothetical protein n=1 Tax=Streptomyces sp. NPDC007861 TaxID=3154893 RepID=UPI0033CB9A88